MENFGKCIDLTFRGSSKYLVIKTPRKGIKPDIEITGTLTGKDQVCDLEIRITNLYTDDILSGYHTVEISAGYADTMSKTIEGSVVNVYTESPGPDKVTVIYCTVANFDAWLNKTIDLKLAKNFTLKNAVAEITKALGFNEAQIDSGIAQSTCAAPLEVNGTARQAVSELKKCFPGVNITVDKQFLKVFPESQQPATVMNHTLKALIQAPQFSGGQVSLIAPWNPAVRPGDFVTYPTNFFQTTMGLSPFSTAYVVSVQFSFSTNGDQNEMSITGILKESIGKTEK